MGDGTELGRVRGLGPARTGAHHWLLQRFTAVGNIILGLFLAFRFFDVVKPLGIAQLQALPGGFGIVVDDLVAGAYANLLGLLRHLV